LDTEGDVNKAWETIRENIKISAKECLGYYEPKNKKTMVRRRMLRIIRQKETRQIAVVTRFKRSKWG
jgi:hypothetical protein